MKHYDTSKFPDMQNTHEQYFIEAAEAAKKSLCLRDRCGAVIVADGMIIARGYNAPPNDNIENRKCDLELRESRKPKSDRTCCLHAEWRAIIQALRSGKIFPRSILYFVRIDAEGNVKYSGDPYCTVCSRLALDVGIEYFALWQKEGVKLFPANEYNDLSYLFHFPQHNR